MYFCVLARFWVFCRCSHIRIQIYCLKLGGKSVFSRQECGHGSSPGPSFLPTVSSSLLLAVIICSQLLPPWPCFPAMAANFSTCSARIQALLAQHCPWTQQGDFLHPLCPERYLDFVELYSGKGRLSAMVSKAVWGGATVCHPCAMFLLSVLLFCPCQVYTVSTFEIWNSIQQNILTESGKVHCILPTC